jgi:hypothetical protein
MLITAVRISAQVSVYGFYSTYTDPSNPIVLGQYEAISGEWLEWDTRVNTTQWPVGTYVIACADGANARFAVVR